MLILSTDKTNYLNDMICAFYECTNDADQMNMAYAVISALDYAISTDSIDEEELDEPEETSAL